MLLDVFGDFHVLNIYPPKNLYLNMRNDDVSLFSFLISVTLTFLFSATLTLNEILRMNWN